MITSKRTFGVEMECSSVDYNNVEKLRKAIGSKWRFEDDGSIRRIVPNPIEVVSPILEGESGETELRKVCTAMKELGFNADYQACGMHVHLGANEFKQRTSEIILSNKEFEEFIQSTADVKDITEVSFINKDVARGWFDLSEQRNPLTKRYQNLYKSVMLSSYADLECTGEDSKNYYYISNTINKVGGKDFPCRVLYKIDRASVVQKREERDVENAEVDKARIKLSQKPPSTDPLRVSWDRKRKELDHRATMAEKKYRKFLIDSVNVGEGKYIIKVLDRRHTQKLINLFLFYLVFDDVFLGMLPMSRRDGNSYCMPLSSTFTVPEVLALNTQDEFEALWYKERNKERIARHKGEHYNDSRYHNVNFHSLFNRHGTVEIRSHGATINPNKIILWTKLHQQVLDMVAGGHIDKAMLERIASENLDTEKLALRMMEVLKLPEKLGKYVARLLNYYSNTNICVD